MTTRPRRSGTPTPAPARRGLRRARVAVAALAATAVLAACGGGSDDAAGGSGGDGDKTLRLAYQAFPSGDLVVKDQKLLEKALPDWDIRWSKFDSGADINTAFIGKSVDIAAIGSSPVARGLSAPLNIPYQVIWVLDVAGDNEALVARKDAGIASIADLKGKKVATPFASTAHYSLLAALAKNNVPESSVTLLDLQPPDIQAAWTRGDIDAAYTWLPSLAEIQKTGTTLVTSRELAAGGKPTLDLGVASTELIQEHPEVIAAWREAEAGALTQIKDDPQAAAAAVGRQLGISPAEAATQLKAGIFLAPQELSDEKWLGAEGSVGQLANNLFDAATFLHQQKKVDAAPPLETFQKAIAVTGLADVTGK
jgi:taurine transport system substrate-binding protein